MNNQLTDYNFYIMNTREKAKYCALGIGAVFCLTAVFYHNIWISLILSGLGLFYTKIKNKKIIAARKHNLNLQFKDMLYSVSSSLNAGKSVESAFKEIHRDLSVIYPEESDIMHEAKIISGRLEMNHTIESALTDFAERSHLEDAQDFVDVLVVAKRSGGNIIDIIKNSTNIINDKIEIYDEIGILLSERKLEQKILNLLPVALILLLSVTVPEYINPVYHCTAGIISITVSVLLLLIAFFISAKIVEISV